MYANLRFFDYTFENVIIIYYNNLPYYNFEILEARS